MSAEQLTSGADKRIEDPAKAEAVARASYPENAALRLSREGIVTLHPSDVAALNERITAQEQTAETKYRPEKSDMPKEVVAIEDFGKVVDRSAFLHAPDKIYGVPALEGPERLADLAASIQEMPAVKALLQAITSKVPSLDETPNKWRPGEKKLRWEVDQPGKQPLTYTLKYDYAKERGNTPTQLEVTIGDGWQIRAEVKDGGLSGLAALLQNVKDGEARELLGVREGGAPFLRDYNVPKTREDYYIVKTYDVDATIGLELGRTQATINRFYRSGSVKDVYAFDQDTNSFPGSRTGEHIATRTLPSETPQDFKQFVENTLKLIPVTQQQV